MKLTYFFGIIFLSTSIVTQIKSSSPTPLSTSQVQRISEWAQLYNIPQDQLLDAYSRMLGSNVGAARSAANDLTKQGIFEPVVAALSEATDPEVKTFLVIVIMRKQDFSPNPCSALLDRLDALNASIPEKDEERAGAEATKGQIATVVAKWLGLSDPAIPFDPFRSQAAYAAFSAQAREKAATMATGSPQ